MSIEADLERVRREASSVADRVQLRMIVAKIESRNYDLFPDEEAVILRQSPERLTKLGIPPRRLRKLGIPAPDEETPKKESVSMSGSFGGLVVVPTFEGLNQQQQESVTSAMGAILSFAERIKKYMEEIGAEMFSSYQYVGLARVWKECKTWDDPLDEKGRTFAYQIVSKASTSEEVKQELIAMLSLGEQLENKA